MLSIVCSARVLVDGSCRQGSPQQAVKSQPTIQSPYSKISTEDRLEYPHNITIINSFVSDMYCTNRFYDLFNLD